MSKINYQTLLDENARLRAERGALREGEMGNATHSNTRAAADIYFQLVEECQIPPGTSLVAYVDNLRETLKAAEKRIAELTRETENTKYEWAEAQPASTQFKPVADLYELQFENGQTCAYHTDSAKAVQWLNTCESNKVVEYVKLERLQRAMNSYSNQGRE